MKVHEFDRLEAKLRLKTRNSGDRLAWFEHEGKVIVRTKRSHGNKDLPENLIRQQLKVNEKQFSGLLSCDLSLDEYVRILKDKGLIPTPQPIPPKTLPAGDTKKAAPLKSPESKTPTPKPES